jgi:hypothetical protein
MWCRHTTCVSAKSNLRKTDRFAGLLTFGFACWFVPAGIAALRTLFDDHKFADVRINVFRVISGRSNYTHLISFNVSSEIRLAALLDAIASEEWAGEWFANSSSFHSVVDNGTFHEIAN